MTFFFWPAYGLVLLKGEGPEIHLSTQIVTALWASPFPFPTPVLWLAQPHQQPPHPCLITPLVTEVTPVFSL